MILKQMVNGNLNKYIIVFLNLSGGKYFNSNKFFSLNLNRIYKIMIN